MTSPKSKGDAIETLVLEESEKEMLAEESFQLSDEYNDEAYSDEGEKINESDEILLLGIEEHDSLGIDCKACGYENCENFDKAEKKEGLFKGPSCSFKLIDLGMSIGHALNTAENHNVDYEISIKSGMAARSLGLMSSQLCIGILLKVNPDKNYFP